MEDRSVIVLFNRHIVALDRLSLRIPFLVLKDREACGRRGGGGMFTCRDSSPSDLRASF